MPSSSPVGIARLGDSAGHSLDTDDHAWRHGPAVHQNRDTLDEVPKLQEHVLGQEFAVIAERLDVTADRFVDAAYVLVARY